MCFIDRPIPLQPSDKVVNRVARAKIKLQEKFPLFGLLLMQLNTVYTHRCATCATDGTNFLINPDFVERIRDVELLGVGIHETLHVVFKHHLRLGNRDNNLFNIVADVIINEFVKAMKCHLPEGCWDWAKCRQLLVDAGKTEIVEWLDSIKYTEVSVEELYAKVADFMEEEEGDGPIGDGDGDEEGEGKGKGEGEGPADGEADGEGDGPQIEDVGNQGTVIQATNEHGKPLNEQERAEAESELDQKIFNAAEMAKARGLLPAWAEGMLEELRDPQIPWQDKIDRFLKNGGASSHSTDWSRPERRPARRGVFEPRRVKEGAGTIVVAVDTSASVNDAEYKALISEVAGIAEEVSPEEVIVIYCDSSIAQVDRFDDPQDIDAVTLGRHGCGGTRFDPPFDWVAENDIEPDAFIYLTDMAASFPKEPDYPTLWVSCVKGQEAPWGETIEITVD